MKKKLTILLFILSGINFYVVYKFVQPVTASVKVDSQSDLIRSTLLYLGCPGSKTLSISHGIRTAENRTGINSSLIACLIYTESNFRTDAVSKRGYRGLLQTPTATGIPLIDICHGADILREKLHLTKGNMFRALTLYKGGFNPEARKQARQVLLVYSHVIKNVA